MIRGGRVAGSLLIPSPATGNNPLLYVRTGNKVGPDFLHDVLRSDPMAKRARPSPAKARKSSRSAPAEPSWIKFTHTNKTLFPETGLTKGDVLDFYRAIAPRLLPHLRDRPITLERLPNGVVEGGPRFWQKNTPDYYPDWIPRVELPTEKGKPVRYTLVNDLETLLYLVNQGALTFHVWPSRVENLDVPDYVLFDLDRSQTTFADVVKIAKRLRELLESRGIEAFVKTSGKSGLHVLTPWGGNRPYDAARAWAMDVANELVAALPDLATTKRLKSERRGHVYIDVIQNARGHHAVPPYVLRAIPQATVSTPLDWDELTPRLNPAKFTTDVVLGRIKKQKTDPLASLTGDSEP
jgi:bifunctional non-homologous end joining protein LigD